MPDQSRSRRCATPSPGPAASWPWRERSTRCSGISPCALAAASAGRPVPDIPAEDIAELPDLGYYAIIASLRDRSEGTFDLPEGTIYPALHRLDDTGLIGSSWADTEGRKRRVYALAWFWPRRRTTSASRWPRGWRPA